jgi:anti-sigma B factor antagonist
VSSREHSPPVLRIDENADGSIAVSGELDMATAPRLLARLDRLPGPSTTPLVLDVHELEFCDSSGLSVFVQVHQTLRATGRSLVLRNPSARLRSLLMTTQLDRELDID